MDKCLNCGKELNQKEGKREKKFCDTNCRVRYWQKNSAPKEPKYVLFKTHKKALEKISELEKLLKEGGAKIEYRKPDNSAYDGKRINKYTEDEFPKFQSLPDTEAMIAEIQAKIAHKQAEMENYGTGIWGKKSRDKAQLEINALNAELFKLKNQ